MVCHALRDFATTWPNRTPFLPYGRKESLRKSQAFLDTSFKSSTFHILKEEWLKGGCWVAVENEYFHILKGKDSCSQKSVLTFIRSFKYFHVWVVPEGLTARRSSCPVCLLCKGWLVFLDPSHWCICLDRLVLAWDGLTRPLEKSFLFRPTSRVLLRCLQWMENVGLLADSQICCN